jgi:hypothetical protein
MKKLKQIIGLVLIITAIVIAYFCFIKAPKVMPPAGPFTNIIIKNSSKQDSILVYITLQAPNRVFGLFGITDTISASKGTFYAYRDSSYASNDTNALFGVVVSFIGDNMPCQQAVDSGFTTGINIFECSVNMNSECFDMSCEDGMNAMLRVSVSDTLNWKSGDGSHILTFKKAENVFPLRNNVNIPGVFPYRCTDCIDLGKAIPKNCFDLRDTCSTYRTCQIARTGLKGGYLTIEYLSGAPQICK